MNEGVEFPVYVVTKDSQDVDVFASYEAMRDYLEPIDIENTEYEAYDAEGYVLQLGVRRAEGKAAWLKLQRTETQLSVADFWEIKFNGVPYQQPKPLLKTLARRLRLIKELRAKG